VRMVCLPPFAKSAKNGAPAKGTEQSKHQVSRLRSTIRDADRVAPLEMTEGLGSACQMPQFLLWAANLGEHQAELVSRARLLGQPRCGLCASYPSQKARRMGHRRLRLWLGRSKSSKAGAPAKGTEESKHKVSRLLGTLRVADRVAPLEMTEGFGAACQVPQLQLWAANLGEHQAGLGFPRASFWTAAARMVCFPPFAKGAKKWGTTVGVMASEIKIYRGWAARQG